MAHGVSHPVTLMVLVDAGVGGDYVSYWFVEVTKTCNEKLGIN